MIQNKENNKAQSQKAQQQKKKEQLKFFCNNKRQAMYCCSQPDCDKQAIKCIGSNDCNSCKKNHARCPREIKIENVFDRADTIVRRSPLQSILVKPEDQIQRLIRQLKLIKQSIGNYNIREWGLSKMFLDLLYNRNLKDQSGHTISNFTISEPIYPDKRYYKPVQFVKDVDRVQKINQELQKRSLILFKIYRKLAQTDSSLQVIEKTLSVADKNKPKGKDSQFQIMLGRIYQDIQKFHNQLRLAIMQRLSMNNIFAGIQVTITEEEISDFKDIAKRIFRLTFNVIELLFAKNQYANVQKFTKLNFQLFNKDRKQFSLEQNTQFSKQEQKMKQNIAFINFYNKQYKQAYAYFINLHDNKYNDKKLRMMIEIIEGLDNIQNKISLLLKYLLLLHDIQKNNEQVLSKIIDCYKVLGPKDKIFQFMKKLNTILKQRFKQMQTSQLLKYLQREQFCIKYLQSLKRYVEAIVLITEANKLISQIEHGSSQIIKFDLKFMYDYVLLQRLLRAQFSQVASKGVERCRKYLQFNNKHLKGMDIAEKQQCIAMIQQYLAHFLRLLASTTQENKKMKLTNLRQALKYYEIVKMIKFEVYYEMAKLSFQLGEHDASQLQDKANQIYPTDVCYRQKALLLYKQYFSLGPFGESNTDKLRLCIDAASVSQRLNPLQPQISYLKGLAHQNLKEYVSSNVEFQKAIGLGLNTLQIQRRIAENNQFIAKQEVNADKRKQILDKTQEIYKTCVEKDPTNNKSLLGYGRVLKLQKKIDKAEFCFSKLIDSQYKPQAYMYLGNLKEQKAIQNDDRDMDMLDQALEFYKLAGKIKQNKQNMVRIYRELDRQRQANKIQLEQDWR